MAYKSSATLQGRYAHQTSFHGLKIEGESSDEEENDVSVEEDESEIFPATSKEPAAPAAADVEEPETKQPVAPPAPVPVVLTARAQKKLARQAALKAKAEGETTAAAAESASSSSSVAGTEVDALPPVSSSITALRHHNDPSAPALSASTPEVEFLSEMGVVNDGSGPSTGAKGPAADSPSTNPVRPEDRGPSAAAAIAAAVSSSSSKAKTNGAHGGGLPHPFSPSNLPQSMPTLQPSSPLPQKRHPPSDFPVSEVKEKKAVRFESSVQGGGETEEDREKRKAAEKARKDKIRSAGVRTVSTLAMIAGFFAIMLAGHPYMIVLVEVCQTLVYKEVTALFGFSNKGSEKTHDGTKGDKWSKTLNWYFFAVANFFLYGESIIYYFKHIVFVDSIFSVFARNHRFISFMLYVIGFVGFVANLQKPYLSQQFALFCWVHMSLLVIVVSSHFIVNNILEGMIWFFFPASLVVCNDIWAYICGMIWGKTPLIKLSPKKTVEGFTGAFFCTLIFAYLWGTFCMGFDYMICPARDLGTSAFSGMTCEPNPVFVWREASVPEAVNDLVKSTIGFTVPSIPYAPFQIHALVMATFASLFAPFGGFFASGFKRAFGIKDFGHSIPGHGGMTDRMDCQFLMGLFSYVYYSSLIRVNTATPASILQTIASMTVDQQVEVFQKLGAYLGTKVQA